MASIAYSLFLRDSVLLLMACLHGGGGGGEGGGGQVGEVTCLVGVTRLSI